MADVCYPPSRIVLGCLCALGLCAQAYAADEPETLEEVKQMLRKQQEIIDYQQDQIEALQRAQGIEPGTRGPGPAQPEEPVAETYRDGLNWEGYALANYQRYDFFENVQDDNSEDRARTDLERFVLELQYDYNETFSFVAEIEFEHGGTGSAVEFEQEEAGEFESEIEAGGEITLEQAYLQAAFTPALNLRFGELVVPFGMVNSHHQPTQYFTLERSLAETALFPSVWHETGISLLGVLGQFRYEAQVVTALDSSGFSGPGFVSGGSQGKLEFDNADDLAFVARADYAFALGATVGASFYTGLTAGNRPRRNLAEDAQVTLYEAHLRYGRGPWTLRGQYTYGEIEDSDAVTRANLNFFNGDVLGISRTPVGHEAESAFIEGGYDVLSLFDLSSFGRLDLFGRYETYDTHAATEGNIAEVDRYDRTARTFGANYKPVPGIVFKAEYSFRTDEGQVGNEQDVYGLGFGVEF